MLQYLQELALKQSILQHCTAYQQHKTKVPYNLESWNLPQNWIICSWLYMNSFKLMLQLLQDVALKKAILQHFTAYLQHEAKVCHDQEPWYLAWRQNTCSRLSVQNSKSMRLFLLELEHCGLLTQPSVRRRFRRGSSPPHDFRFRLELKPCLTVYFFRFWLLSNNDTEH